MCICCVGAIFFPKARTSVPTQLRLVSWGICGCLVLGDKIICAVHFFFHFASTKGITMSTSRSISTIRLALAYDVCNPTATHKTSFLHLPAELRVHIYKPALDDKSRPSDIKQSLCLALSCKQMYGELEVGYCRFMEHVVQDVFSGSYRNKLTPKFRRYRDCRDYACTQVTFYVTIRTGTQWT